MKVVSYLKTVPANNSNIQKEQLLIKFAQGVCTTIDNGIVQHDTNIIDCDVSVIQGWVNQKKISTHLKLRNDVIETQKNKNKFVVTADANLFLYKNKTNPHGYLRYSLNGIFPNSGIYCDNCPDSSRWEKISKDCNIVLQKPISHGQHILLCCQRNGGWSMGAVDVQNWIIKTVHEIRKYSSRPIVIRAHPGDKSALQYLNLKQTKVKNLQNVKISNFNTPLEQDLNNTWAVVNHNSSSIVGPIIMGYHAFITDPHRSQCAEVAHTDFSMIDTPQEFDRQRWLERISMFHWKFSELEDGTAWRHMRNYCQ